MKQQDVDSATINRWVERADEGSPEARAGALLRQAVRREPPEADRLAAIGRRLRADRRRPHRHWALRLAIALALLLSGGALTAAAQRYLHLLTPTSPTPQPQAPAPNARRATHHRTAVAAPSQPPAPLAEPVAAQDDGVAPQAEVVAAQADTAAPQVAGAYASPRPRPSSPLD
jgi:hypothetical protein